MPEVHSKAQQRRARMTPPADLAVQYAFLPLKDAHNGRRTAAFDTPARAIQDGDLRRTDLLGQVAPQPDRGLARLARRMQRKLDAPPRCGCLRHGDRLLAYNEAGPRRVPASQDRARTETVISRKSLRNFSAIYSCPGCASSSNGTAKARLLWCVSSLDAMSVTGPLSGS